MTILGSWLGFATVQDFLIGKGISFMNYDYNEYGVEIEGFEDNPPSHLDIYSMKYDGYRWVVDWDSNPECKVSNIKDVFAVIFGSNWLDVWGDFEDSLN